MTKEEFREVVKSTSRMPPAVLDNYVNLAYGIGKIEEWHVDEDKCDVVAIHNLSNISYEEGLKLWNDRQEIILKHINPALASKFINDKVAEFKKREQQCSDDMCL